VTNKYHHMRTASILNGSKKCPWPGCLLQIPLPLHSCERHWNMLPKMLRDRIWAAYEVGQELEPGLVSLEYRRAENEAARWTNSFLAANSPSFSELPPADPPTQ
jgi:hypothetical protein